MSILNAHQPPFYMIRTQLTPNQSMGPWVLLLTLPLIHWVNFVMLFNLPGINGPFTWHPPGFLTPSLIFSQWAEHCKPHTQLDTYLMLVPRGSRCRAKDLNLPSLLRKWSQEALMGAREGQEVSIECISKQVSTADSWSSAPHRPLGDCVKQVWELSYPRREEGRFFSPPIPFLHWLRAVLETASPQHLWPPVHTGQPHQRNPAVTSLKCLHKEVISMQGQGCV